MERKSHSAAVKQNGNKQHSIPTRLTTEQVTAAMVRAVQRVRHMSHEQRVKTLKDAGILTAGGKLAQSYR